MPRGGQSVRTAVLAAFPKSSLDGAEVSSPRTSVSPVRPSFTNESREREDDEKNEPVEGQRRSFAATGTESRSLDCVTRQLSCQGALRLVLTCVSPGKMLRCNIIQFATQYLNNKEERSPSQGLRPVKSRMSGGLPHPSVGTPAGSPENLEGQDHASVYLALLKASEDVIDVF
jgi:hypothetical protein